MRRFYLQQGYADFRVVSAVAELTPDRENFYITFTVDEGEIYHFGKVGHQFQDQGTSIPRRCGRSVPIKDGAIYNAELVDKSIDALTNAAGTKGYAFAEVHPRIRRDHETRTIDVVFDIEQDARVYVEKINIVGNTRTLDKVIRREFRLVEGDAFNRVLVDRSRTRIKALGFFKDVDIKTHSGLRAGPHGSECQRHRAIDRRTFARRRLFVDQLRSSASSATRSAIFSARPISARKHLCFPRFRSRRS